MKVILDREKYMKENKIDNQVPQWQGQFIKQAKNYSKFILFFQQGFPPYKAK